VVIASRYCRYAADVKKTDPTKKVQATVPVET
jgi:hypothetical protein